MSVAEPIDQELEQEVMLFKQRLELASCELYDFIPMRGGRTRPNCGQEWL
jgi:hypothetical protein